MKKAILKKGQGGFTLIELMIVVAIVGILATLAIYGVRKYIANAKTAEARNSLGQMSKDAVTAYEKESMASATLALGSSTGILRALCASASSSVPSAKSSIQGKKYQSAPGDWGPSADVTSNAGFPCLRFSMSDPQYFLYNYQAAAGGTTTVTMSAEGDLNGDGNTSRFSLAGAIQSGVVTLAPAINETSPEE